MARSEKIERVAELKARIGAADSILLTEYRGLTVTDISEVRRSLAEGGASYAVVKNTLMRRAAEESAMAELESLLEGPTAVAFIEGDAVATAKKLVDAIKRYPTLVLKGGFMEGRMLSAADARALADLESREAMLSKIAGLMKGEMSRAASMFQSAQSKFLSLLEAYKEKVPGEMPAPAEADASAAEPTEAAVDEPTDDGATDDGASGDTDIADPTETTTDSTDTTDAAAPAEGEE
jgi:large subunit ribosomal protein L10